MAWWTRRSASTCSTWTRLCPRYPTARLTRRFGPDAQHLDFLVPTLLDGVVVDPALGLDALHLDPIVPTLPDGAAVDPAIDLDVQLPTFFTDMLFLAKPILAAFQVHAGHALCCSNNSL